MRFGSLLRVGDAIPADSFYEWKKAAEGKHRMRVVPQDGGLFSFTALWYTWTNSQPPTHFYTASENNPISSTLNL